MCKEIQKMFPIGVVTVLWAGILFTGCMTTGSPQPDSGDLSIFRIFELDVVWDRVAA